MLYEHLGKRFAITEEQYAAVKEWIQSDFISRNTINRVRGLRRVKRVFKLRPGGFYVHDEILHDAMIECGYRATYSPREEQWFYNISEKSKAVRDWYELIGKEAPKERVIWGGEFPPR